MNEHCVQTCKHCILATRHHDCGNLHAIDVAHPATLDAAHPAMKVSLELIYYTPHEHRDFHIHMDVHEHRDVHIYMDVRQARIIIQAMTDAIAKYEAS